MNEELSSLDRRLLDRIQRSVPLVRRPYGQLAEELNRREAEVIQRVSALSGPEGVIREIAGIFDAAALGFASTLAAARCPGDRLGASGAAVAGHPGVSHCYGREGELNLWFTLVVPPDSALHLAGTLEALARQIGAERMLSLPCLRRYKLQVRFDLGDEEAGQDFSGVQDVGGTRPCGACPTLRDARPALPDAQVRAIRALEQPLPAEEEPFAVLAAGAGLSGDDLLVQAADFLAAGWLRRYSAVLRHRLAGAACNVMVAWQVPPEGADGFGRQAAQFRAVSHCYLRPMSSQWPYNLYTMIHGPDRPAVEATIAAIAAAAGDFPRAALPTLREYKKAKVQLFSPDFAAWEAQAS